MKMPQLRRIFTACFLFIIVGGIPLPLSGDQRPPFARTCLKGRYVMATTGWDIDPPGPPYKPIGITGYIDAKCTGKTEGTYTGAFIATYPGALAAVGPAVCQILDGTYTIDPNTGAMSSSATLDSGPACFFSRKDLAEVGYVSDPTAKKLYLVETGQQGGDIIHYVWEKTN